jgi:hypothetical protein
MEEARERDATGVLAEARRERLAGGELHHAERKVAAGGQRQGEGAADARIDVGHLVPVGRLAEALDRAGAAQAEHLGDRAAHLHERGILEGGALDLLAALRLDHRARNRVEAAAVEVAQHVDRELRARAALLHHRGQGGVAEEEVELAAIGAAEDALRAAALAHLDEHGETQILRQRVGMERARRAEPLCGQEVRHHQLVDAATRRLAARQEGLAAELGQLRHEIGEQHEVPLGARQHHLAAVVAHRLQHVLGVARIARERCLHPHVAERQRGRDVG